MYLWRTPDLVIYQYTSRAELILYQRRQADLNSATAIVYGYDTPRIATKHIPCRPGGHYNEHISNCTHITVTEAVLCFIFASQAIDDRGKDPS